MAGAPSLLEAASFTFKTFLISWMVFSNRSRGFYWRMYGSYPFSKLLLRLGLRHDDFHLDKKAYYHGLSGMVGFLRIRGFLQHLEVHIGVNHITCHIFWIIPRITLYWEWTVLYWAWGRYHTWKNVFCRGHNRIYWVSDVGTGTAGLGGKCIRRHANSEPLDSSVCID